MGRLPGYLLLLATAAGVAHAAWVHLPYPFSGDQALFLYGARRLAAGDRLYVEFWDFKQPGIYWFYEAGGRLFGWTREGVHLLEALWMVALAGLSYWTARRIGVARAASCLAPLASVAAFYAAAGAWHLTQLENLVGLPLLGVTAAALLEAESRAQRVRVGVLMGLGAGTVAVFKLVLAVVPAGLCLLYLHHLLRSRRQGLRATLDVLVPAVATAAAVVIAAVSVLVASGAGVEAFWANFTFPVAVAREVPRAPAWHLVGAVKWLFGTTWPFLPLALLGAIPGGGTDAAVNGRRSLARTLLVAWIVLAGCAVLVQKLSWWEYHFAIFVVPIGLLATIGLQRLAERSVRVPAVVRAAVLAVAGIGVLVHQYRIVEKMPDTVAAESAVFEAATRRALGGPLAGDSVYVLGDPRLLLASGGRQAIPVHGWAWEFLLESQWRELPEDLRRAAPRAVYVSRFYLELLCSRAPALVEWLREAYEPRAVESLADGFWLLRRAQPGTQPTSSGLGHCPAKPAP